MMNSIHMAIVFCRDVIKESGMSDLSGDDGGGDPGGRRGWCVQPRCESSLHAVESPQSQEAENEYDWPNRISWPSWSDARKQSTQSDTDGDIAHVLYVVCQLRNISLVKYVLAGIGPVVPLHDFTTYLALPGNPDRLLSLRFSLFFYLSLLSAQCPWRRWSIRSVNQPLPYIIVHWDLCTFWDKVLYPMRILPYCLP